MTLFAALGALFEQQKFPKLFTGECLLIIIMIIVGIRRRQRKWVSSLIMAKKLRKRKRSAFPNKQTVCHCPKKRSPKNIYREGKPAATMGLFTLIKVKLKLTVLEGANKIMMMITSGERASSSDEAPLFAAVGSSIGQLSRGQAARQPGSQAARRQQVKKRTVT